MAATLIDSHAEGFADGNGGHVYSFGGAGAPAAGDLDVLCVNSITTVSTPAGWDSREPVVANQAAYIFTREAAGGEGASVTITTSGNFNTIVSWSRWSGVGDFVDANSAQANNSNGTALPTLATGDLPETGMLVIAFAALNNHDGDLATSPSWTGFTPLESASLGTSGQSASLVSFTAYEANAGTASESINSVTWTNNTRHRYALGIWFTASGGTTHDADGALATTATRTSAATLEANAQATVTATAGRTTAAAVDRAATAAATTTATLATVGAVDRPTTATLPATGGRTAAAAVDRPAQAAIAVTATLEADATVGAPPVEADGALSVAAGRTATAALDLPAAGTRSAVGSLAATAAVDRAGLAAVSVTAGETATATLDRAAGATRSVSAVLTADAAVAGSIVFRPNTGTITRPNTGTILRP